MEIPSLELLKLLTNADAVPGHEGEVRAIFRGRLAARGDLTADRMGNVYCTREGTATSPRVLIESHMDEVGFLVQLITERGFIRFVPVGGWWTNTLLAQRVRITTQKGKVEGIIGSTPPHFLPPEARDRVVPIDQLYIDVGAQSRAQAMDDFGVVPGCPIVPAASWTALSHPRRFSAKAFDNRVGVALVIEALERVEAHPNSIIGAACAQEEVGMRGAQTAWQSVKPDVAIILEAPPADDTPGFDPDTMQGKLGHGAQIRLFDPTMIANPRLADFAIQTARDSKIAHQIAVRRSGGTDAAAIHKSGAGVPSIVLGVPIRYIHSHVGVLHIDDYLATLDLLLALITTLNQKAVDSFYA